MAQTRLRHTSAKNKNVNNDVCKLLYLPLHGVIAKLVIGDLDLLFEGKRILYLRNW